MWFHFDLEAGLVLSSQDRIMACTLEKVAYNMSYIGLETIKLANFFSYIKNST